MKSFRKRFGMFIVGFGISLLLASNSQPNVLPPEKGGADRNLGGAEAQTKARLQEAYGKLPLYFIKNDGQLDKKVKFYEKGSGHTTFFTKDGIYMTLTRSSEKTNRDGQSALKSSVIPSVAPIAPLNRIGHGEMASDVVKLNFVNANPNPKIIAEGLQEGKVNYFIGNDPKKWRTNITTYKAVVYKEVYPGIDIKFYGNNRQMEYDIVVKPGADPSTVQLAYEGIDKLELAGNGDLEIVLKAGKVIQRKPVMYQEISGKRVAVAGKFKLHSNLNSIADIYGFEMTSYDKDHQLTIDPSLVYSTYLGGSGNEWNNSIGVHGPAIAVDGLGNAYVTGATDSTNFPVVNALQPVSAGSFDVFVAKLNATGTALVYSTYLGGGSDDLGYGIAVDGAGNAYVTGATLSSNFPTANALQPAFGGGYQDAFVAKLNAAGSALVYSTYLGGSSGEYSRGIGVDGFGNAYIAGATASTDFPMANALQPVLAGGSDGFVAEVNATGTALVYSTYLGGSGTDGAMGIAVDASDNAYVTGATESTNFPTVNALQSALGGGIQDAFVAKLNAAGSALVYSTYLGGSVGELGRGIAVDGGGNVYVTGTTSSTDFPTINALQPVSAGMNESFVTKLNATGTALVYSTYLGGSDFDDGFGIAADGDGNAYVIGQTSSTNFPTFNAIQSTLRGTTNVYVAELNATGTSLLYSTYLGGSSGEAGNGGISVDGAGYAYVTGVTYSSDFPTVNALQPTLNGTNDAFVAKLTSSPPPTSPDLIISALSTTTTTIGQGKTFTLSNTAKNQGTASAGSFVIAFHLSTNTTYGDANDIAFTATRSIGSLATGASNSANTTLTVPSSTPPGSYYLCAMADSGDAVTEGDETNNSFCATSQIQVVVASPDLIVSALSTAATAVAPGKTFTVTNTVTNQGTSSAGSFVIAFHLSTNAAFGDGDDIAFTTTRSISSLAAGASSTATTTLTVPSTVPLESYFVCAKADNTNAVAESDETNNTRCINPISVQIVQDQRWDGTGLGSFVKKLGDHGGNPNNPRQDGIPDIMISSQACNYDYDTNSIICGAVYVYSGKDRSLIFQITGTGWSYAVDAGDLNGDGVTDIFVGDTKKDIAQAYSGLDGSPIAGLTFNSDGTGNFGVCVSAIGDITGDGIPDLLVGAGSGNYVVLYSGADGSRIGRIDNPDGGYSLFGQAVSEAGDVNGDGIPDFIVGAPQASPGGLSSSGSAFVFSGQRDMSGNFPLLYRLDGENAGDGLGGCCGAVDSIGDINGDGKTDLAVAASNASPNGKTHAGSVYLFDGATGLPLQRPDGLGPMPFDGEEAGDFLGGMICQCGWVSKIGDVNGDGYPDFMAGEEGAVVNGHTGAGRVLIFSGYDASVLLRIDNPDPNYTPSLFGASGATLGDLNGDGTIKIILGAAYISSTTSPGSVYLMSLTPPAPLQVTRPDLIVTNVTPNAPSVNQGATLSVTDTVKNQGQVSTGIGFKVGYYLHPSAGTDIAITTTRSVAALAAGASSTGTTSLTIPTTTPPNSYSVCAKADSANAVSEINESNNTLCSAIQVTVPAPDLVMTVVSTTATVVAPGKPFTLSNTVKNQGGSKAGAFTIAFHLSLDSTYGGSDDIALTATRSVTSLAIGASSAGTTTLTVPATAPLGTYHVCAIPDSGNTVAESNELNNPSCTATTIQVTRPDLVMTAVTPNAATVNRGSTLSVGNTVQNQGLIASTAFRVGFRLSVNNIYGDSDDVVISTFRSVTSLAAGASSAATSSLTIPSTTPVGTYYVCAMADSLNAVVETNEGNNTLCSGATVTVQ